MEMGSSSFDNTMELCIIFSVMNSVNMHVIHLNESYMQKKHLFIFNCVTFQIQLWIKMRLEILFSPKSMLINHWCNNLWLSFLKHQIILKSAIADRWFAQKYQINLFHKITWSHLTFYISYNPGQMGPYVTATFVIRYIVTAPWPGPSGRKLRIMV